MVSNIELPCVLFLLCYLFYGTSDETLRIILYPLNYPNNPLFYELRHKSSQNHHPTTNHSFPFPFTITFTFTFIFIFIFIFQYPSTHLHIKTKPTSRKRKSHETIEWRFLLILNPVEAIRYIWAAMWIPMEMESCIHDIKCMCRKFAGAYSDSVALVVAYYEYVDGQTR